MTALPYDHSKKLKQAVQIMSGIQNGTPMLQNPLTGSITGVSNTVGMIQGQITAAMLLLHPELGDLQTTLNSTSSSMGSLQTHTDRLIFGDGSDVITSPGLVGNASSALAAINLNDTLNKYAANGASQDGTDPCSLLQDFFGSLLGAGNGLLSQLQALVAQILSMIQNALGQLLSQLQTLMGQLQSLINQVLSMISNELAAFAQWLANEIDYGLSSFLSSLNSNPCMAMLTQIVGTTNLTAILNT